MFTNIKYIDPKLFQEDGQPRYNLGLQPTDWKSFTSFTDSDDTYKEYNLPEEGLEIVDKEKYFEVLYKDEDELIETGEKVKYDKVFGLLFNGYNSKSFGDGTSINSPLEFISEQVDGKIYYHKEYGGSSVFYAMKLLAGVTYKFNRSDVGDGQIWFYNEDGSSDNVGYDERFDFTKTFDKDTTCYIEFNYYNRNEPGVDIELSISPLPARATQNHFLKNTRYIFSDNDSFIFGQNPVTYSFWYYKGENPNGSLISLMNNNVTKFCLFIEDGILKVHNGYESDTISSISNDLFNKKGINSPVYICFSYDFANSFMSIFVDGLYSYGKVNTIDLNCNKFVLGGSTIKGIDNLDGTIKWLRTYDRVLTEDEILSLYSEFDNCPGNGTSTEWAMGGLPDEFDEDTAYVIRRYQDGTRTYIKESNCNIKRVGIFACPDDLDNINENIPDEITNCEWLGEQGDVIVSQYSQISSIKSSTVNHFVVEGIDFLKFSNSDRYLISLSSQDNSGVISFNNCRFSSDGCNINNGDEYNEYAGGYFMSSGKIGNFIIKNCNIIHTDITHDAFHIVSCKKSIIRNVNIYSAPGLRNYNSNCFAFISSIYDDFINYASNDSLVEDVDIKNVNMTVRGNSNEQVPGLIIATNCKRLKLDTVNIMQGDNLTNTISNVLAYNGLINIRWINDYDIKNININLPMIKKVQYWPVAMFCVTELDDIVSVSQGLGQRRVIDNINIEIGSSSLDTNSDNERNYYISGNIYRYLPIYTVFCVMSNNDPMYSVHILKNCTVTAERCVAIALGGVLGDINNINGQIRINRSRVDIENFTSIYNDSIMHIWDIGEINVNNLTISNPSNNNLVNLSSSSNNYTTSHVYVKNSNCQIQSNNYNKSGAGENNAFIYCPNTTTNGGFQMRGMSHVLMPVDIHRSNGHGVSLRLHKTGSQTNAFRFPPEPYNGIAYNLVAGKRKMTIHFAEAEHLLTGKTYKDMLDSLWIELVTEDNIYNSKINGKWSLDEDEWSVFDIETFKFTLNFTLENSEKVFVRVYYNTDTHINGGLFLDPKIDWE